jgi:hypothetical protein
VRHLGWNFHDKTLDAPRCLSKLAMPPHQVSSRAIMFGNLGVLTGLRSLGACAVPIYGIT